MRSSYVLYFPFSETKKFRLVLYIEAESKVSAYIVFENGHTFGASKSGPCIYKLVELEHH